MSDDLVVSRMVGAPAPTRRYVIGLGANLGDRLTTLISAVRALAGAGVVLRLSTVYESQAVGPPQPDYLNAAILLGSKLLPLDLLGAMLTIERAHGRERRERWGPRTLDLDLLYSPGLELNDPALTLPHPELHRRAFALAPLLEVLPDARDERSGVSYQMLLDALGRGSVRRFETDSAWPPIDAAGRVE